MRVRTTAATAVLLLAALTACGGGGDKADTADKPTATATPDSSKKSAAPGKALTLGGAAKTTGDGGTGVLEVTPDTVVYVKQGSGETSANGVFAVVTMKDKAVTAVAADEPAPMSGGGWQWIAPDGESIGPDGGNSSNVVMDKYNNADPVQPGTYQWRAKVFDLTAAQAKGGTLLYTDGEGTAFRWRLPAVDSGPHVAEVKKQLAS
ncbi:hypothetical protein [Streptomyces mirabilis]|uniref:hypothetical protein n=1 Tax=Streptomyces mirabilis TaxID=68239 RepID=UPI00167DED90|nr:hypothetical protein [Streptomyces mirabilis]